MLAYLQQEPGWEAVDAIIADSVISSVNWAEVIQKAISHGVPVDGLRADVGALGLQVIPFTADDAETAGRLWQETKPYGLSLGDRACLSIGVRLGLPVLTEDRAWLKVTLPNVVPA